MTKPIPEQHEEPGTPAKVSRRSALKILGAGAAVAASVTGCGDDPTLSFHDHYQRMSADEVKDVITRLEARYEKRLGKHINIDNTPPQEGVVFGYAINISKCKGYRDCVKACVKENNQGRDPQIEYIRVLEVDRGQLDLEKSDHYYDHETVPAAGKFYIPVQCQQCDDPPCVKACPVKATWTEPDGITVIDYDWCIGCRYCATACPYWARRFNWEDPTVPKEELNPNTHYLSNRPRDVGVMEKCTFCLQRTRKGKMPACQEACPTGARVFGNLLDSKSELRYILEHKNVFRLKEDLKTEPKFWYYTD